MLWYLPYSLQRNQHKRLHFDTDPLHNHQYLGHKFFPWITDEQVVINPIYVNPINIRSKFYPKIAVYFGRNCLKFVTVHQYEKKIRGTCSAYESFLSRQIAQEYLITIITLAFEICNQIFTNTMNTWIRITFIDV